MSQKEHNRRALDASVSLLARRDHSRLELTQKLQARDFDSTQIEYALNKVTDWGYLNESRFATSYAQYRIAKGFGPVRVKAELAAKGVGASDIKLALSDCCADWFELCAQCCAKKFKSNATMDLNLRGKAYRYLSYRGFAQDHIQFALDSLS